MLWKLREDSDTAEPTAEAAEQQRMEGDYAILCKDAVAAESLLLALVEIAATNEVVAASHEIIRRFAVALQSGTAGNGPILRLLTGLLDEIETPGGTVQRQPTPRVSGKKYRLHDNTGFVGEVFQEGDSYRWTDNAGNDWAGMSRDGTRLKRYSYGPI